MRVLRDAGVAGMAGMINQPRSALRLALWTSHWGGRSMRGSPVMPGYVSVGFGSIAHCGDLV